VASRKIAYGTSTALTNANLYLDYTLEGKVTVGTTPTINTEIRIYVVASFDGTTWPDVFDGTTSAEPSVTSAGVRDGFAKLAASLNVDATTSNVAYPFSIGSVASLFGGVCPAKFVLFTTHNTGVNLNATGGNHVFNYRGVYETVA
jgi:hypothetical protein